MARLAIQSDKKKDKVAKLIYAVRDPYQIIRNTSHGKQFVRILHKYDSPELKYMAYDSYPHPLSLQPCEPIAIIGTYYLNQSHAPLINPLMKSLYIDFFLV